MRSFPAVAKSKPATSSKQKHSIHNRNLLRWAHWSCRRKQCLDLSQAADAADAASPVIPWWGSWWGPTAPSERWRPSFWSSAPKTKVRKCSTASQFEDAWISPMHHITNSLLSLKCHQQVDPYMRPSMQQFTVETSSSALFQMRQSNPSRKTLTARIKRSTWRSQS